MNFNEVVKGQTYIDVNLIRAHLPLYPWGYSEKTLPAAYTTKAFLETHKLRSAIVNIYPERLQKLGRPLYRYTTFFIIVADPSLLEVTENDIAVPNTWFKGLGFRTDSEKAIIKALI